MSRQKFPDIRVSLRIYARGANPINRYVYDLADKAQRTAAAAEIHNALACRHEVETERVDAGEIGFPPLRDPVSPGDLPDLIVEFYVYRRNDRANGVASDGTRWEQAHRGRYRLRDDLERRAIGERVYDVLASGHKVIAHAVAKAKPKHKRPGR